ncbi:hypothetical protein LMANV2_100073 [Leptospira interrogans serovar Manilae]|uniref:Uncharacterized protein n=1 Tax=Leptospira interrogans serovar Manilae TaxID=214675 RepID=A0AAQ1SLX2_LEPIR|nr:hypothetical protein [Leptospira interrogans]AKP24517.1 hypothetical protein LIMLP_00225 [Leptospira interrogans serovar Manilae]AKP28306.1 hypothetical protein LIMHP_00220 [Leptospira interrogans serovar Manilae]EYU65152.1 hypothetical protein CI00_07175 [Leptospira interrogans serovar Manilae]SOR59900.1 hypothetical protein LMANV2_100073 [Leptospira interrogans serovar Manilae]
MKWSIEAALLNAVMEFFNNSIIQLIEIYFEFIPKTVQCGTTYYESLMSLDRSKAHKFLNAT